MTALVSAASFDRIVHATKLIARHRRRNYIVGWARLFAVDVGALAVAVEDHDELGRAVDGGEGVRRHGGELGGLAGLDDDLAFAERQPHPPLDDEEPVVPGVDPLLGRPCASVRAAS